jgi:hypothetical protein
MVLKKKNKVQIGCKKNKTRRSSMANLKAENVNKCVSILKRFIDDSPSADKESAVLALKQLRKITAGMDTLGAPCGPRPHIPEISEPSTLASPCGPRPKIPEFF